MWLIYCTNVKIALSISFSPLHDYLQLDDSNNFLWLLGLLLGILFFGVRSLFLLLQIKRPTKESSKSASNPGWITNESLCQSFGHPLFGKRSPLCSWTLFFWLIHFAVVIVLSYTWLCHQDKLRMLSLFHWRISLRDAALWYSCHHVTQIILNNVWREANC